MGLRDKLPKRKSKTNSVEIEEEIKEGEPLELIEENEEGEPELVEFEEIMEEALTESVEELEIPEVKTENIILLLRSNSYKIKEQIHKTLNDLLSERKPDNVKFLLIKKDNILIDWLEEKGFYYEIYKKWKGEDNTNRNIRVVTDCKALVAFIKRNSTGDSKWKFVRLMRRLKKQLYLVYDENGNIYDKRWKKFQTPYAQD